MIGAPKRKKPRRMQPKVPDLVRAAASGDAECIRAALESDTDPGVRIHALALAVQNNECEAARILLEAGVPADGEECEVPLRLAALAGATDAARLLLQFGANPDQRDAGYKDTALICAASMVGGEEPEKAADFHNTMRGLLEAGADPTIRDSDRRTAMDYVNQKPIFDGWEEREPEVQAMAAMLLKAGSAAPKRPAPWVRRAMDAIEAERRLATVPKATPRTKPRRLG